MAARLARIGVLALAVAVLAGCSPATTTAAPTSATAGTGASTAPQPDGSDGPAEPVELTCETMLSSGLLAGYTAQGWTAVSNPLYIGSTLVADGMSCTWGDHASSANDVAQVFGFGTLTADVAAHAQADLAAQGWSTEQGADGIIVTEPSATALVKDAAGYGITYLFGDGWVKVADTREALILVVWPR